MATNMRFSELTTASSLTDSDIFALAKLDGSSESGYMSYKATLTAIAIYLNKLAVYSSDLDTNDKHIIGAINELKRLISLIPQFNIVKVQVLPTEDISDTTIYLVPSSDPQTQNVYDEFIHIDNAWEQIGSTAIDLSDYYTKSQIDGLLATKANTADVTAGLALKENKADMQTDVKEIIESCYEEKTVTGNPITIKTISGSNAKALTVSMNPIQDLHGYDHPWAGGTGKNKLPLTLADLKSNNTLGTWNDNSYTYAGVTYTVNLDEGGNVKSVTANGTASADVDLTIITVGTSAFAPYLVDGTGYKLNGCSGGSSTTYSILCQANGSLLRNISGDTSFTYASGGSDRFSISITNGYSIPTGGITFYPMIRLSTEADATFAPYSNICPISGRTEASVKRMGKNLAKPYSYSAGITSYDRNGNVTISGTVQSSSYVPSISTAITEGFFITLQAGTYKPSTEKPLPSGLTINVMNKSNTSISLGGSFTLTEETEVLLRIAISQAGTYNWTSGLMIEAGATATVYEPYQGETHTHQYGQTVYGGEDDFVNGGATVTLNTVDMGDLTYISGSGYVQVSKDNIQTVTGKNMKRTNDAFEISSIWDVYQTVNSVRFATNLTPEAFKTLVTGQTLCYELATLTTIETSAEEISLLKGNNVVSTDGDNMELSYQEIPDITPLVQYVQTLEARIKALEEA